MFALQSSSVVVNAIVSFIQPAEVHRSEEHVPGSAGQRLEPDGQRGQNVGDVDPALLPADAAVGRYPTNLEVLRVRDRLQLRQVEPIRRSIERRRPALVKRLVGPDLRADPLGESVGAEQPPEDLLGGLEERPLEPVAGEQVARVRILDGERVAVATIAELELAPEVDRPDDIGPGDRGLRLAGMGSDLGTAPATDATVAHEDPVNGGVAGIVSPG